MEEKTLLRINTNTGVKCGRLMSAVPKSGYARVRRRPQEIMFVDPGLKTVVSNKTSGRRRERNTVELKLTRQQ